MPEGIKSEYGQIIKFDPIDPIDNIPTSTQAQFIRLWYTQFFPDDIVITTDIDMFPLSKWYFKTQIENISDEKYVFLRFASTCAWPDPKTVGCVLGNLTIPSLAENRKILL